MAFVDPDGEYKGRYLRLEWLGFCLILHLCRMDR